MVKFISTTLILTVLAPSMVFGQRYADKIEELRKQGAKFEEYSLRRAFEEEAASDDGQNLDTISEKRMRERLTEDSSFSGKSIDNLIKRLPPGEFVEVVFADGSKHRFVKDQSGLLIEIQTTKRDSFVSRMLGPVAETTAAWEKKYPKESRYIDELASKIFVYIAAPILAFELGKGVIKTAVSHPVIAGIVVGVAGGAVIHKESGALGDVSAYRFLNQWLDVSRADTELLLKKLRACRDRLVNFGSTDCQIHENGRWVKYQPKELDYYIDRYNRALSTSYLRSRQQFRDLVKPVEGEYKFVGGPRGFKQTFQYYFLNPLKNLWR